MPKVNQKYSPHKAPPIDWLRAAILERQKVYGYDLKKMAKIAGVEYGTMRSMMRKSPWEWSKVTRENVCHHFDLNIGVTPDMMEKNSR